MANLRLVLSERSNSVSVVICAYTIERWPLLERSLESVLSQEFPAREVIVVVDGSEELERRSRDAFPEVTVTANQGRRGLSDARNAGVRLASGDIVAFLDDDAVASPGWLAEITEAYGDDSVLGVGGLIEPIWERKRPSWWPPEFDWVVGCSYRGMPVRDGAVRNVLGANASFRRDVLEIVGGFDTGLGRVGKNGSGCEETELCIRATRAFPGGRFLALPGASVQHLVPDARASVGYFVRRCFAEGRSKSRLARALGSGDGLGTERTYALRALPAGVIEALRSIASARDPWGAARAGAIVLGLVTTTAGYALGRLEPVNER